MRKGLIVVLAVTAFIGIQVGVGFATGIADTGPGCGLGKEVWKNDPHTDNIGKQMLISTTNNPIIPLQAFAITTGTLGCKNNGKVWVEEKVYMFASTNFESLSQEMAQGQGEHLASLATLMGVPADRQADFFTMAQEGYATFATAGEPSPKLLVRTLNDGMAMHPVLAKAVVR
jgi:Protein of unknown function (DUF3015)